MTNTEVLKFNPTSQQTHPNSRPRDAATIMLVDSSGSAPRVLMGKRHEGHVFMPGRYVFPGGRVDPTDYRTPIAGHLATSVEQKLLLRTTKMTASRVRAIAIAGLREICEETGVCIGRPSNEASRLAGGPWQPYASVGEIPDLSGLYFIARAITPPRVVRRFDTRFFVLDASAISHRVEGIVGPDSELVELGWLTFDEARKQNLHRITEMTLSHLEEQVKAGLSHDAPVPFYHFLHGKMVRQFL